MKAISAGIAGKVSVAIVAAILGGEGEKQKKRRGSGKKRLRDKHPED